MHLQFYDMTLMYAYTFLTILQLLYIWIEHCFKYEHESYGECFTSHYQTILKGLFAVDKKKQKKLSKIL